MEPQHNDAKLIDEGASAQGQKMIKKENNND